MTFRQRRGALARAFVLLNRAFGAGAFAGGVMLTIEAVLALFRGRSIGEVWIAAAIGISMAVVGAVYLRASLSRKARAPESVTGAPPIKDGGISMLMGSNKRAAVSSPTIFWRQTR